jgi:organic hydroperoxide reductase OsmC/OhrA
MTHGVHRYRATCSWDGETGQGYESYDRTHQATCPPAATELSLSSDPTFRGDAGLLNPEQLLVLAASSCQLLSFLAVAARSRVDVVSYRDDAEGFMPEDEKPVRITAITLRPEIAIRGSATVERLNKLVEIAHRECYIANSTTCDIAIEPRFSFEAANR